MKGSLGEVRHLRGTGNEWAVLLEVVHQWWVESNWDSCRRSVEDRVERFDPTGK